MGAAIAVVVALACRQITLRGAYAPYPVYRAQVDALLDGRLALSRAPEALAFDLAWTPSGVQQVWGLGAPLWQLPFEAAARAIGGSPFPDRVALVVWLAVMMTALLRAFRPRQLGHPRPDPQRRDVGRTRARDSRAVQIGALLVTGLLPGFVTLLRCRMGVYEEAAMYAYGAAMLLLAGLVGLRRAPTTTRYLLLVGFAGLTGLFRPTVWFYGLATVVVASAIVVRGRARHAVPAVALGAALFVAGGTALFVTNALRFGRGSEFGHRLNVEELPGNLIATRFSYPFERVATLEAAQELVGSLFDGPERRSKRGFYQPHLHYWQSPTPRWREYYATTFSWPYVPVLAAGLGLAALAWRRRGDPVARALGAWAVIGGAPLVVFYLSSPSMSSRYQLDLAPAFAALLVIAWRACATRWPRLWLAVLAVLWIAAVATSKRTRTPPISEPVDRDTAARRADAISHAAALPRSLPAAYDLADPYLPAALDLDGDYVWCGDARGARIACDATPLAGDFAVAAQRTGDAWQVDRYVRPDTEDTENTANTANTDGTDDTENTENAANTPDPDGAANAENARDPERAAGPAGLEAPAVCAPARAGDGGARSCPMPTGALGDPGAVHDLATETRPLYLNGTGWQLETGNVPPALLFYVADPAYIALDVTGPPGTDWTTAVRVAVGLAHLRLVGVADTATGARLRFEGELPRGLQIAFVAFGPDTELDRPRSAFALRSIRWRD